MFYIVDVHIGAKQMENPFTPESGSCPHVLMGRDAIIDEFIDALDNGTPGNQDTFPLLSGSKGIGKTTILVKISDILRDRGFFVYRCVGRDGMAERFKQALVPCESDGQIELDEAIMMELEDGSCRGVAIIIDDMGMGCIDDFRIIASAVQKTAGTGNRVVMAVAGMPNDIDAIEDDGTVSFLRRMHRLHIDAIDIDEAKNGIRRILEMSDMEIDDEVLNLMAEATDGYPFIIQRIAYDTWNQAYSRNPEHIHIIGDDFMNATPIFVSRIYESIVRSTIRNLSPTDRAFLEAMSIDGGEPSRMSNIAERMGKDLNYANTYRTRLVRRDVIASIGHGLVVSKIPYLMMYMGNIEAAERLCGLYSPAMNMRSKSRKIATDNLRKLGYDI